MRYRIDVERRATKALARLPREDQRRLTSAIDTLMENPRPVGCVAVRTAPKGTYRIRVGDYRVIYIVLDDEKAVIVARIVRRDESTYRQQS
jgi:mRNA interferase RelE/StbE